MSGGVKQSNTNTDYMRLFRVSVPCCGMDVDWATRKMSLAVRRKGHAGLGSDGLVDLWKDWQAGDSSQNALTARFWLVFFLLCEEVNIF